MQPFYVAGPTGSGKSAVALELAAQCGGEIVNGDAFQLYCGMDILTAKPSAADFEKVQHHLYSVVGSNVDFDVASYAKMASQCIAEIAERRALPIIVGGSGLYIKALTHGLSPLPAAAPQLRKIISDISLDERVAWLRLLDPEGCAAMDLQNPRYVERALEISLLSGRPASEMKADWANREVVFRGVLLQWETDILVTRIHSRTRAMAENGLIDEVSALPKLSNTAQRAIGIREIRDYLAGKCSLDDAIEAMQIATRQYAKRQRTWFRREKGFVNICLSETDDAKSAVGAILSQFPDLITK
ncbi:MAG: tRNA dimethylallyltransferase [Verrucomicrobiales bacterium]|jgi:tRNA dimethylallyltransferase